MAVEILRRNPGWLCTSLASFVALLAVVRFIGQIEAVGEVAGAITVALPGMMELGAVAAGFFLIGRGSTRRVGNLPHCARCGYPREAERRIIARCPECQAPWRWYGGFVEGRPVSRPVSLWVGVLLIAFAAFSFGLRTFAPRLVTSALPNEVLLRQLTTSPGSTLDVAWSEFATRAFAPEELTRLEVGLLDKRRRFGFLSNAGETWLSGRVGATGAPQALRDRFYGELFELALTGPYEVELGRPFELEMPARYRGRWPTDAPVSVYVGGFRLDGATRVYHRAPRPMDPYNFVRLMNSIQWRFTFDTPGEHVIRLEVWIVAHEAPNLDIIWREDGSPLLPPGLPWTQRLVFEHKVNVSP